MKDKKIYLTTPIYYVNDVPHIGHAYTTVAGDVLARYHRLNGDKVFYLTGTDEHGAKVAQAASNAALPPKEYTDQVFQRFVEAWESLNIWYDFFIRTTHPSHEKIAQEILQKIYDKGYIYKGIYEGLYCVGCEKFLTPSDLTSEGRCNLHPNLEPQKQREKNYFFKLSAFQDKLIGAIQKGTYQILPKERENEVLGKLNQGLEDISISREAQSTGGWGIPIPWDPTQTIYVWVEALFNYYSATQFVEKAKGFWSADTEIIHLIGKDILWFHAVIWEALLLAAGLPLPKKIFAHGFFTVEGQKMSKSLGNVISPDDLIKRYAVDGARYLLLTSVPFGADGDISLADFDKRYNADLANGIGNLVARVAKLAERENFKSARPAGGFQISPAERDPARGGGNFQSRNQEERNYQKALENFHFEEALRIIQEKVSELDKYIDENKPWEKKGADLAKDLKHLTSIIYHLASLIDPFMPDTSAKIKEQFGGPRIKAAPPLFPRLA